MDTNRNMILKDNMWTVCRKLSLPAVIAMVLFGLNVVFDAIFIGRIVGEGALAGVSVAYPLTQVFLGLGSLIGVGAGSYLSILIGANNKEEQGKLVGNVNFLTIIISAVTVLIGMFLMKTLLQIMGASGEELEYAVRYFRITLAGAVFWIGGIGYNMLVRAEGRMGTAAFMMGIGLVINVAANYVLMVIFDFGVEGAAWGTNIGMFIYVLLFFIYCGRGKASFEANAFRISADKKMLTQIISLGMPSLIMTIMTVIQGAIILRALNVYGTPADVAFYGVVFRLFNLFLTPIYGLMRALQPAVGVNFGAKEYERVISAYKTFSTAAFGIMLPLWLLSMFESEAVLNLMLPESKFAASDIMNFRIFISIAPLLCIVLTAMTFWPAINKAKPATVFGIGRQILLYIPLMIILPKIFGIDAIYVGSFGIDFFLTVVIAVMLRREFKNIRMMKKECLES